VPDLTFIIVVVALAFLLAGFVKGILGQGLPTVAVGLLSLVMSPGEATALLLLPAITTNIWQGFCGPSTTTLLRRLWPTLLASVLGTFIATSIGLGLLTPEAASVARKALGGALIAYGILGLSRIQLSVPPRFEWWLGPLMGTVNGMIATATGVFMIPVIPYIQALGLQRDDLVQAQGISFTVSTLALAVVLVGNGTLNTSNALGSALAVAVAFVGMMAGQRVREMASPGVFRILFFGGMLVLGAHLAFFHR
jgi:uncharacterized membrane protein YfcA